MNLEEYINKAKSETACFSKGDSDRVTEFIVGMQCVFQIPALAVPLFQVMDSNVDSEAVINFEILKGNSGAKRKLSKATSITLFFLLPFRQTYLLVSGI
jgi:hypothetical protein